MQDTHKLNNFYSSFKLCHQKSLLAHQALAITSSTSLFNSSTISGNSYTNPVPTTFTTNTTPITYGTGATSFNTSTPVTTIGNRNTISGTGVRNNVVGNTGSNVRFTSGGAYNTNTTYGTSGVRVQPTTTSYSNIQPITTLTAQPVTTTHTQNYSNNIGVPGGYHYVQPAQTQHVTTTTVVPQTTVQETRYV